MNGFPLHLPHSLHFWHWVTRLGEAGIVLPVALAVALWLLLSARSVRIASSWLIPLGLAASITTISKIAFLGWGIGIASIDFTGFSGHSMFSAAIYPMLGHALAVHLEERSGRPWRRYGAIAGYALAALIAVSRVFVGAHSVSEIVSGFALGALASGAALLLIGDTRHRLRARWLALGLGGWLAVMPLHAAPSQTHGMVIRVALKLSQRSVPFQRADLHRMAAGGAALRPAPAAATPALPALH